MAVATVARPLAVAPPGRRGAGGFGPSAAVEQNRRTTQGLGFWDAVTRPDPYGGIVLLPIFLALFVPLVLTAAAAFSVMFPLALLPLLAARSRLFPTLLAMGVIFQVALVLTGWIAADVFSRVATHALAAMAESGDAEVLRVAGELDWATGILTRTALALVAPTLAMIAWLVFLRPSGAAAGYFAADTPPVPGQAPDASRLRWQRLNRGSALQPSPRRRIQSRMLARETHVRSPASSPGPHRLVSGHSAR